MREVRPRVGCSLEEGVLRVLYEGPATAGECAAGLLHDGYATEVVIEELESQLADLVRRACIVCAGLGAAARYTLTETGSERLASLVEVA